MPPRTAEQARRSLGANITQAQARDEDRSVQNVSEPILQQSAGAIGPVGMTSTEALNQGFITEREKEIADAQQSFQETQQDYQDAIQQGVFGTSAAKKFLTPGLEATKEFIRGITSQGRKDILKALGTGKSFDNLTEQEKINLAYLIAANKKNENVLGGTFGFNEKEFEEYQKKYGIDLETLRSRADDLIEDFEEETSVFEDLIKQYEAGQPQGLGQSFSALIGQYDRPEGTLSRKELQEKLGKEGIAYLKANNPQLYYRFNDPQTGGGILDLANQSLQGLSNSPEDRRYAARIMEARAIANEDKSRAARDLERMGGSVAGVGFNPLDPVPVPRPELSVTGPVTYEQLLQQYGRPNLIPPELLALVNQPVQPMATGITPFNINQFYASLPQYTQQGIMSPNLAQFYQNLQAFPRVV
tara:strand:+ start:41 stop:1288 length:1248 start_codon:yes stop_codon:yes gene_type:complete